jgi:hypothetical protein
MQVIYADESTKRIQIDCERLKQFLLEQGLTEKKINHLRIHLQQAPSAQQRSNIAAQGDRDDVWGLYSGPHDVYLFTHDRPRPMAASLNRTLHHELRHFMKNGYRKGEIKLPYAERPSEVDAYTFASKQAPACTLLSIPGESPLSSAEDTLIQILAIEVLLCGTFGAVVILRWLNKLVLDSLLGTSSSRKRGKRS